MDTAIIVHDVDKFCTSNVNSNHRVQHVMNRTDGSFMYIFFISFKEKQIHFLLQRRIQRKPYVEIQHISFFVFVSFSFIFLFSLSLSLLFVVFLFIQMRSVYFDR